MQKHEIRTPENALVYLTESLLATVEEIAMQKKKSRRGYNRHIGIAQTACDQLLNFKVMIQAPGPMEGKGSRVYEVMSSSKRNVAEWAKQYEPKE